MKIIIFSPTSTELKLEADQPLGGADTALLQMIEDLATEHEVEAYIPISKNIQGSFRGAFCFPFMDLFDSEKECDVLIQYRKLWAFPNTLKYKHAVFYSQDTTDTPCFDSKRDKSKALDSYSRIWILSEFHKKDFQKMFKIPEEKYFILGNYATEQKKVKKNPLQFIYASTPFRGLEVLLKLWTRIIVKYPTATLHIFSSMKIYGAEQLDDLHFGSMFSDLRRGRFKNLIFHGTTPREEMLECMKESFLLLYPNTYPETYCNVIMEARACHTPFITSDQGALHETGSPAGCFISGAARSDKYFDKFLKTLNYIIEDPDFYKDLQQTCYPIRTPADYKKDLLNEINGLMKIKEIKD